RVYFFVIGALDEPIIEVLQQTRSVEVLPLLLDNPEALIEVRMALLSSLSRLIDDPRQYTTEKAYNITPTSPLVDDDRSGIQPRPDQLTRMTTNDEPPPKSTDDTQQQPSR